MARYTGASCKKCRSLGVKLFLKGVKCYTNCVMDRRKEQKRSFKSKPSEYKIRLVEKQRARSMVGATERPFDNLFRKAARVKGKTGEIFLRFLETRLDNIVRRIGFAVSLKAARQLVLHGHVRVNGKVIDVPSYQVKVGDMIGIDQKLADSVVVKSGMEHIQKRSPRASFIEFDEEKFTAKLTRWPERDEMSYRVNEQLIVEYYSK